MWTPETEPSAGRGPAVSLPVPAADPEVRERSRAVTLALLSVLLLAAGIRFWGLLHDLPFSYFGDELHFMRRSMALGTGDLNPHWFHKPAFLMYVLAFFYGLYFAFGMLVGKFDSTAEFGAHFLFEPAPFLLIGRLVVAAFGVATVYLVYRIGRRVFGTPWAGIAGALAAAVLAPMVYSAQTIKSDVPCGFLMTLSVYVYLRTRETPGLRPLVISSLLAGVAMGTHYYAIVLVPTYLALELLRGFDRSVHWGTVLLRGALVGALFLAGFFLSSPYNFLDPTWVRDSTAGARKSLGLDKEKAAHFEPDTRTEYKPGPAAWAGASAHFFKVVLGRRVLGIALSLLVAAGLIVTLARRETRWYGLLVLIPCLFFFLAAITVAAYHVQPRHLNALYPLLATLIWPGARALLSPFRMPEGRVGRAALVLAALACLPTLAETVRFNRELTRLDSRLAAYRYVHESLPKGARILVDDYGPFLNPSPASADRMAAVLAGLDKGPFTHHQDLRIELLRKYPPADGLNMDELGHQWWLPREKSDAELRSNPVDLDMGSPLVTRQPKTVEELRADGVRFVVTNSEARDQYFTKGPRGRSFPSFARFYRSLEKTRRLATFDPREWNGKGPVVWVYDITRPAPPGQPPITLEGRLTSPQAQEEKQ
ncbi:MAG TPA: glycosyltransferase family 39 protein [Thermoanaerobaculia bacterium]|nr:glycosyltransferase family 39 protein [Thermoanaerobaculia bacterium]